MTVTHGFELLREQNIPELNALVRLYRHVKTGAELLSVQNDDENKVFGITFCTPPNTSNGIAHIMEHSVLCGSRKYPVKEPFVELLKGSLNTFVNAWTFPDKTSYPLASQNLQDFYNLIDVYLDAVFYPNITPYTLKQEGWHYELDAPEEPLAYKGVVFNEMKGAYSDPENVLGRYIQQSIFPDTSYGVDSGGDPTEILDLTYEEFKRFHDTYYHPSNARLYFYGDDPLEERLRIANDYLKDFDRIDVPAKIALQARFDAPRQQTYSYAVGQDDQDGKRGFVTVNWLLPEGSDPETALSFAILNHILIGTPASPLRKALIDSGLGEDLAGSQLEQDLRQMYFSTGLKGVSAEDTGKVEAIIHQTLSDLAEKGIDADMIEAAVNTIEFSLRENNTGSFPRGLLLMVWALRTWLYNSDPVIPLAYEAPLAAVKQRLAAGERFFEGMIGAYLLDNAHRTTVILKPDPELQQRQDAAEQERLAQARASMTGVELQQVVEETRRLKEMQETPDSPEALATIPCLQLEDLDKQNKLIPLQVAETHGAQILYHDLFTNGIVYLDLGFNLHALPQEYLPYVTLFFRALLEMGTETEDFVRLSQRIGRKTGGIDPTTFTSAVLNSDRATAWGILRSKSTTAQAGEMLAILRDVLLTVKLDNQERFRQIVLEEKASQESGLVPSGHRVALSRLRARFSEADWASEQIGGIEYLLFLRQLAEQVDKNWSAVVNKLETMRHLLINRNTALCNVTLDEHNWAQFQPQLAEFLAALPAQSPALNPWTPAFEAVNEGLTIPAQVNYVGKGANLYRLGYQVHGSIVAITNYLNTTWLWERVRVHGGAYGGFNVFDRRSGTYVFVSYRDPNLLETLENYDQTAQFLRDLKMSQEELLKTIIGAIGLVDAYQLPDAKGYTSMMRHLTGETDAMRQQLREQILSTSADDFKNFGSVLERVNSSGLVSVVGSTEAIEKANADRGGNWLQVQKVL
ncbi:MAG: insulinase family protein [Chloroflexi bacterium]|nr:insulinase family protein [Chloroflexota bacterium]